MVKYLFLKRGSEGHERFKPSHLHYKLVGQVSNLGYELNEGSYMIILGLYLIIIDLIISGFD